jgi:hypothetical protein
MAKPAADGKGTSFCFNNLTRFTPGKTGQIGTSATKTRPFAANSGFPADHASQPRTALAAALSNFDRARRCNPQM